MTTTIDGLIRYKLLLEIDLLKAPDRVLISEALTMAEAVHAGTFRYPSRIEAATPYIIHPMRVALILLQELQLKDTDTIISALLHDVIESSDRQVRVSDIENRFGRTSALMVSILTKPPLTQSDVARNQMLYFYYERIKGASLPTRMIKLADRLDNVREAVNCVDNSFRARYLQETKEVFLPFAKATDKYLLKELATSCQQLECSLNLEARIVRA